MKEITAGDARSRFGRLLDAAQSAPVRVTRKGKAVGVMMSIQQAPRWRMGTRGGGDGRLEQRPRTA